MSSSAIPQILLDKITELVEYNYHLRTDPSQGRATPGKLLRFRDQGVVDPRFSKAGRVCKALCT